jgi:hypothetical protein
METEFNPVRTSTVTSPWLVGIVDKCIWPITHPHFRKNTHLTNLFCSALSNVHRAGRTVSDGEHKFLLLVLSYWRGWSATSVQHMQDPAFCYIRHRWSNLDLHPILDNMTYEEEVHWMPKYIICGRATTLLFASKDRYYVYETETDSLMDAGATLEEVYNGLWQGSPCYLLDTGWEEVPPFMEINSDPYYHFADYDVPSRKLEYPVQPFHPPLADIGEGDLVEGNVTESSDTGQGDAADSGGDNFGGKDNST